MGPILETDLRKTKTVNTSRDILWLGQALDNMSIEKTTIMCDPASLTIDCLQANMSLGESILTDFNDTERSLVEIMGERQDPYAIPMTIVYMIIFITGIIGNVCTCIVISKNRYMHTATNYYLFSLAVSDLLLLILGLPQDINHLWYKYPYLFGEVFCVIRGFISEASTNASIFTITAFTVERYLAICHPLKAHTMSRLSRAIKFIVAIWIMSALSAVSMGYQLGIIYEKDGDDMDIPETATCSVKRELSHAFIVSTVMFFIFPATLLCILYALIGLQLKRSTQMGRKHTASNVNGNSSKIQGMVLNSHGRSVNRKSSSASRKDVIKMLVAVVVAFFLCWTPFHAQRLMAISIQEPTDTDFIVYSYLTNISGLCYYISATINPILYSILSLKFRHAFRDTLGRCLGKGLALGRNRAGRSSRTMSFFNSTLKSGLEMTEDFTIVSEVHDGHLNGGTRKMTRLAVATAKPMAELAEKSARKKTSTISTASQQLVAFDDDTVSDYIDQVKETQA